MSEYRLTPRGRAVVDLLGAVVAGGCVVVFVAALSLLVAAYLGLLS